MKQFVADKINYIVNCSVIDDNGIQLVGTSKSPFILLENSKNEENCIVILKKIKKNFLKNKDNSLPDLLSEYIDLVGMDDFKKIKNKINKNYLFEFYLGIINKDFSDFEYENKTNVSIIEGADDIGNEDIIRPYLDKIGAWSLSLNEQEIILNLDTNTLKINNNEIKSNEIFNFLYGSSDQYSSFIID
jgi:hypothetical protein